jgi:hypothetical protein
MAESAQGLDEFLDHLAIFARVGDDDSQYPGGGPVQTKALIPVIARPTISDCTESVPS